MAVVRLAVIRLVVEIRGELRGTHAVVQCEHIPICGTAVPYIGAPADMGMHSHIFAGVVSDRIRDEACRAITEGGSQTHTHTHTAHTNTNTCT